MLEIPTARQLAEQANQDVETEINGALGARLRASIATALAGLGYVMMLMLKYLARQIFLHLADTPFALLIADIYGVKPNEATASTGPILATGTEGSTFTGTEILQRADGAQYQLTAAAVVDETGEVQLTVAALEAGVAGNTDAGATLTFVSPPVGVEAEAIVTGTGLVDGFDVETPESVVERTLALIRSPRRGGSEPDYVVWAEEVSGIGKAYALGSFAGVGTVLVIVTQVWDPTDPGQTPVPSAGLISNVEAYLETRKPAGLHLVAVQGPTLQNLDPYIVLEPDTPDIRDAVTKSLAVALASVEPNTYAYYDDLVAAIDRAAGEVHHQLWVSDGLGGYGPYNTKAGYTSVIVPGTITWTEPP